MSHESLKVADTTSMRAAFDFKTHFPEQRSGRWGGHHCRRRFDFPGMFLVFKSYFSWYEQVYPEAITQMPVASLTVVLTYKNANCQLLEPLQVYPEAITQMPVPPLFSFLFFLMLCLLAMSSIVGKWTCFSILIWILILRLKKMKKYVLLCLPAMSSIIVGKWKLRLLWWCSPL